MIHTLICNEALPCKFDEVWGLTGDNLAIYSTDVGAQPLQNSLAFHSGGIFLQLAHREIDVIR